MEISIRLLYFQSMLRVVKPLFCFRQTVTKDCMLCGDLNSTKMTFVSLLYGNRFRRTPKDVGIQGENKAYLYSYISRDLSVIRPSSVDYKFSTEVQGKITAATNFQKHPPDWPKSPPPPNHYSTNRKYTLHLAVYRACLSKIIQKNLNF